MNAITPEPDPIEIDPRPCELCGCTIDQHEMVDNGEGPEFFCDDFEREIYLATCSLVRDWELQDPRDSWRHTGDPRPAAEIPPPREPDPYRTAASTISAFWFVAGLDDIGRLKAWFADHSRDVPALLKLLESKRC